MAHGGVQAAVDMGDDDLALTDEDEDDEEGNATGTTDKADPGAIMALFRWRRRSCGWLDLSRWRINCGGLGLLRLRWLLRLLSWLLFRAKSMGLRKLFCSLPASSSLRSSSMMGCKLNLFAESTFEELSVFSGFVRSSGDGNGSRFGLS